MSKDIRSFFTVVSKKNVEKKEIPSKKRTIATISDSDEDETPNTSNDTSKTKKRKTNVKAFLSDSEDESSKSKTPEKLKINNSKENKKNNLKPVKIEDVFGKSPVKQTKVPDKPKTKTELDFHEDDDFEKTLIELDEETLINNANVLKTPNNKTKRRPSDVVNLNDSGVDPDQDRFEKRKQNYANYQRYLNRGKPVHLGQKEYPKGKPDCLKNLCFLRTGVLDSLDGETFENLVKEHGARVVHAISRKVNYLVVGDEPGPAKLEKARSYNIPNITEDELLDLILVNSGMQPKYVNKPKEKPTDDILANKQTTQTKKDDVKSKKLAAVESTKRGVEDTLKDKSSSPKKLKKASPSTSKQVNLNSEPVTLVKKGEQRQLTQSKDLEIMVKPKSDDNIPLSWTDKYKPKSTKDIIGQQGNDSSMNKLKSWLQNWYKMFDKKTKGPRGFADSFRCALLSGPPGVGKTTTATLVAKELNYDVVEFNASDTRNKKLLADEVARLLHTKSLAGFFKNGEAPTIKHVLLMDEVDGMSGNEDRGGMQELIALIKKTQIPIICMCNDRYHQKITSLANYCLDLRFNKPRMEQIRGAMMSICFKENLKLSAQAIAEIIMGTENDVRQTLTHLSFFTRTNQSMSEDVAKVEANNSHKDVTLGPWEVCRKVFGVTENQTMSLSDKCKLFFYDYSLGPLFIHENYRNVEPQGTTQVEKLRKFASAAHALSVGDKIDSQIRSSNNWSLLDLQSVYSSVLPGYHMQGSFTKQIAFPRWLGSNSKRNKCKRLLGELETHMLTSTCADAESINMDYLSLLSKKLLNCLLVKGIDGVQEAVDILNTYNLTREDLDSIMELSDYNKKKPFASVDSKVKAAFTRTYNKTCTKLPYTLKTSKKRAANATDGLDDDESNNESEDGDNDIINDKMIMINTNKKTNAKKENTKKDTTKKSSAKTKKSK